MTWLLRGALVAITALLYGSYLDRSPIYLNNDEAAFALQAHTVVTTGRDTNGRWLPLYFQIHENVWYHPVIVYAMAAGLAVLPFAEWAVRVPTVTVAVINVLLVHALARRLTGREATATLAAAVLILTPAHFMHARLACDYLFPLPFVLTWMRCLLRFLDTRRTRWLVIGMTALGIGLYTYIASVVMMPLYVLVTLLWISHAGLLTARRFALATAAFVVWLLPLTAWLLTHPEMYAGLASRYQQFDVDVVGAPTAALSANAVVARADVFARFFDPWFLFDVAQSNVMSSTYQTGVFLTATGVLMAVGVAATLWRARRDWWLVLVVFVTAPVAASLITEPYAIDRALMLLPAGVLLAAHGLDVLLVNAGRAGLVLAIALLAWMPWQFDGFYRDYLGDYRARSAFWFNGNNRGAMRDVMDHVAAQGEERVYLAENIPFVRIYWQLYTRMYDREDLLPRTVYFHPATTPVESIAPGSSLLTNFDDPIERELLKRADVRAVQFITEPSGSRTFVRFVKTADRSGRPQ